jgi:hypothetical protein
MAARLRTVISRLVLIHATHGNSGCPWVFGCGGNALSPTPALAALYIKERVT